MLQPDKLKVCSTFFEISTIPYHNKKKTVLDYKQQQALFSWMYAHSQETN